MTDRSVDVPYAYSQDDLDREAQRLAKEHEAKTGEKVLRVYVGHGMPLRVGFLTDKAE